MTAENYDHQTHYARAAHFRARGIAPRPADQVIVERTGDTRSVHPARLAYFRARIRAARNAPTRSTRTRGGLFVTDELRRQWDARR